MYVLEKSSKIYLLLTTVQILATRENFLVFLSTVSRDLSFRESIIMCHILEIFRSAKQTHKLSMDTFRPYMSK